MKAMRHIIDAAGTETNFNEVCLCGNTHEIDKDNPEYSTCCCLRVYRIMKRKYPDGTTCIMWGMYFDPYLRDTEVGQFLAALGELPEDRFPSAVQK